MKINNIFCVMDPTAETQHALARAAFVARAQGAAITAYLVVPKDEDMPDPEGWLEKQIAPFREKGLKIEPRIEHNNDWRQAIASAAERSGADLITKSTYRRSAVRRWILRNSDHLLLKSARCPILFSKTENTFDTKGPTKVLVSVNVNAEDPERRELREIVTRNARDLVEQLGAEMHVVNSFPSRMEFVHPPDLAKRFDVPRSHAHVAEGSAEEVVSEVCQRLGNPLVVMGAVIRPGVKGMVVGNTAERILNAVPGDVLAIVRAGFAKLPPQS